MQLPDMDYPPTGARIAALIIAALNLFGLLFFAGHYFSPEHRSDLLIYGLPTIAFAVCAAIPNRSNQVQPAKSLIAVLGLTAIAALAVTIYRDLILVNGTDWPAVVLRSAEILLLLFLSSLHREGLVKRINQTVSLPVAG